MRRPTRLAIAAALSLPLLCGAYTGFWFYAAHQVRSGLQLWAASMHKQHLDLAWRGLRVAGFPFAFRLDFTDMRVHDRDPGFTGDLHLPALSASARPWSPRLWRLALPAGLTASTGQASGGPVVSVRAATGNIAVSGAGSTLWLAVSHPTAAKGGEQFAARRAELWLIVPAHPPKDYREPAIGIALDAHDVALPKAPPAFRNPIAEASFGVTVMGPIPTGRPREAAAAWSKAGGTLEVDHVTLRWGDLFVTGNGTMALDGDLQPIGAFSGGIEGYDGLMKTLVADGRIRRGTADLAQVALTLFAKRGPDGRQQIPTSFRIQDGEMYLGPAPIGPAPHIDWD